MVDGMGLIGRGVWHKDGPVAQIEAMIDWLDAPLDAEHRRKVQANLEASVRQLRGAVEALRDLYRVTLDATVRDSDLPEAARAASKARAVLDSIGGQ